MRACRAGDEPSTPSPSAPARSQYEFIIRGYARPDSAQTCASPQRSALLDAVATSVCALNNQTVNVYSHLLGLVFCGHQLAGCLRPSAQGVDEATRLALPLFLLSQAFMFSVSAAYHAVVLHASPQLAERALRLDQLGTVAVGWGFTVALSLAAWHRAPAHALVTAGVSTAACAFPLRAALFAPGPFNRPAVSPFARALACACGASAVGVVALLLRTRELELLGQVLLSVVVMGAGYVLLVFKWPERTWVRRLAKRDALVAFPHLAASARSPGASTSWYVCGGPALASPRPLLTRAAAQGASHQWWHVATLATTVTWWHCLQRFAGPSAAQRLA